MSSACSAGPANSRTPARMASTASRGVPSRAPAEQGAEARLAEERSLLVPRLGHAIGERHQEIARARG